jgi:AraC-like DNA-binding protein
MKNEKDQHIKYLTANPVDELWGLYATTIGFQSIAPNTSYPPKGHPSAYWFSPNTGRILHEFTLLYITSGEGVFESASCKPTTISAGTMLLLHPGEWHTYKPSLDTGWNEYWMGFNGEYVTRLIANNFFSSKSPLFNVGFNEQIVALFKQGIETASFQKTAHQQVLAGIASLLLGFLFYSEKNNAFRDKAIISQIEQARVMMRENTDSSTNPVSIARSLNLSYSWFRRVFKQYTGFSPAQYQMEIKIQKSKDLLTSTSMPVKEIAFDLNFESVSYFVTFFKSKTGMSPTEYRNDVQGKNKL